MQLLTTNSSLCDLVAVIGLKLTLLMCCASAEGPIDINMTEVPIEEIEWQLRKMGMQFGGHWKPKDCRPHWKVPFTTVYMPLSQIMMCVLHKFPSVTTLYSTQYGRRR